VDRRLTTLLELDQNSGDQLIRRIRLCNASRDDVQQITLARVASRQKWVP